MHPGDPLLARQIGNRPGQLQHPVIGLRRQLQLAHGGLHPSSQSCEGVSDGFWCLNVSSVIIDHFANPQHTPKMVIFNSESQ